MVPCVRCKLLALSMWALRFLLPTISNHILQKLRWRIIVGDLKPVPPLRKQELEAEYGSSRGPIRESQRLLLQTGLVVRQPCWDFGCATRPLTASATFTILEPFQKAERSTILLGET